MKRVKIRDIILSFRITGNVAQTAKDLGTSRWTVQRWVKRSKNVFGKYYFRGLQRKSTRPHLIHTKLTPKEKEGIINLSNTTHLGARKIRFLLKLGSSSMTV